MSINGATSTPKRYPLAALLDAWEQDATASHAAYTTGTPRSPKEDVVNDADRHYSMLIEWSDEDQVYIVSVPELSRCKTHGSTYEEAVRQGQDAIETWIDAMRSWGRPVPPPRIAAAAS